MKDNKYGNSSHHPSQGEKGAPSRGGMGQERGNQERSGQERGGMHKGASEHGKHQHSEKYCSSCEGHEKGEACHCCE